MPNGTNHKINIEDKMPTKKILYNENLNRPLKAKDIDIKQKNNTPYASP